MMRRSRLDRFFGGKPGSAEEAKRRMHSTYGRKQGDKVFEAVVIKRQRKEKGRRG